MYTRKQKLYIGDEGTELYLDLGEDISGKTSGYQEWLFTSHNHLNSPTGLNDDNTTYSFSVVIDSGATQTFNILGNDVQRFDDLVLEINKFLELAEIELSYETTSFGALRITSNSTGTDSSVLITDSNLFANLNYKASTIEDAVAGTVGTSTYAIKVKKPDETEVSWTATLDTANNHKIKYIIQEDDLDQFGTYYLQAYAELASGWKGRGETVELEIYSTFK